MKEPVLIEVERKSDVLKKVKFGCLTGIPAINFTAGCLHSCVYCYAKGYPSAPPDGQVFFWRNTRRLLEKKLLRNKPSFVVLNTASDSFQPHPKVLNMAYECMEILIKNRVSFSFLTKGFIPEEFYDLFKKSPSLIYAHIGLTTLNDGKRGLFEPFSAPVEKRLKNIENLIETGIIPSVRVDPIIPLHTDSEENFHALFKKISEMGVKEVSVSALHIRNGIKVFLVKRLGALRWKRIEECFEKNFITLCGGTKARLIKRELLHEIYRRAIDAGKVYGIDVKICACKNPDFPYEVCPSGRFLSKNPLQLNLFSHGAEGNFIHPRNI
jgi:DNA repair photolyase